MKNFLHFHHKVPQKKPSLSNRFILAWCFISTILAFQNIQASESNVTGQQTQTSKAPVAKTVKGVIYDNFKQPLVGVTVIIKNTQRGTTTDLNGRFSIKASPTDTLVFSMIGYISKEFPVGVSTNISILMAEHTTKMDEVVVIGYGEQLRKDVTGSISTVEMKDLLRAPVVSFDQALAGRIAGVQVTSNDGQPGQDMNIIIRGANSLTQSNSPLYVIDGFPTEDFSSASLNPNDIASINVLKDASSTAIYGSRAANGVVIIETKKGTKSKPTITYNGLVGVQQVTNTIDMMNAHEFVLYQIERDPSYADMFLTKLDRTLDDYYHMETIDWQDKLFRNAVMHTHNISVTGGTDKTKYMVSGSMASQDGVIINTGYTKYQGRISLNQVLSKKFNLGVNVNYSDDKYDGPVATMGDTYSSYLMYRTWAYRPVILTDNDFGDNLFDEEFNGTTYSGVPMNPVVSAENEQKTSKNTNLLANIKLEYNILKSLKLVVRGGFRNRISRYEQFNNSNTYYGFTGPSSTKGVNASFREVQRKDFTNENLLIYRGEINKVHRYDATLGFSLQKTYNSTYGFENTFIPLESLGMSGMQYGTPYDTQSQLLDNALMSFFGRINYNYKSRYLLTATFRADGSSKFRPSNRWGYFPSAAVAWRMSEEKFIKKLKFVDEAKLRFSYGLTGNNRIPDNVIYRYMSLDHYYSFNNETPQIGLNLSNLGNKDLKWETTEQLDLGFDMTLFRGRFGLTVDLYRKTTRDMLIKASMPYSTGVAYDYRNIAKMRNDGLEISFSSVNIKTKSFTWTTDFNISFNRSKVLTLNNGQEKLLSKVGFSSEFNNTDLYCAYIGGPIASFYGLVWDGVYQVDDFNYVNGKYILKTGVPANGNKRENIQPGDIKYVDQNRDGDVNSQDMVVIGRGIPIHTGGFNNNFSYKGFNLNIFFQWNYGNDIFNANRIMFEGNYGNKNINQFKSYADHWTFDNPDSRNHRVGGQGPLGVYSSRTVEDGSYLRLKTVQLSYSFPKKLMQKIKMQDITVFISGQNLWTWTNYSGLDPEVSTRNSALTPGFDYSAYARNRTFSLGVNITF